MRQIKIVSALFSFTALIGSIIIFSRVGLAFLGY
jgi:ABC-type cobalt transport system substrate-binding protein